jgi:hypothetical protein
MIFKAAISFPVDSTLPRDRETITPHFFGDNAAGLADALKQNLVAYVPVGAKPFIIKVYDATKAPPSYPLAVAEQTGTAPASGAPREVCLCLSYYSSFNRPSYRGRLYLPSLLFGGAQGTRPTTAQQQAVVDFKDVLTQGLPGGTSWVVYSKKMNQSNQVTHVWCDDEWDIQRSRGLRGTSRIEAQV